MDKCRLEMSVGYDHRFLFLIIGRSGCGKDTFVRTLVEHYPILKQILSYTTRKKRDESDTGHTFLELDPCLSKEENFNQIRNKYDIVAETVFDGNLYFADTQMVDNADIWIVDPRGLRQIKEQYKGRKVVVSIYLDTDRNLCYQRMLQRGDCKHDANRRLLNDDREFAAIKEDASIIFYGTEAKDRLLEFKRIFGDLIYGVN